MPVVYGSTKTHTTLDGTTGNDILTALAGFTAINGNGGSDTITTAGSYNYINLASPGPYGSLGYGGAGLTETVTLTGPGNTIIGGSQNFTVSDTPFAFITGLYVGGLNNITVGDGNNNFFLAGSGNTLTLGAGVNMAVFAGSGNTVHTDVTNSDILSVDTVVFTGINNTLDQVTRTNVNNFYGQSEGNIYVSGGAGGSSINLVETATTLTTGGAYNTITQFGGSADITPGSGHDTVDLTGDFYGGAYDVHLAGKYNTVTAFALNLTVDGGIGSELYNLTGHAFYDVDFAEDSLNPGGLFGPPIADGPPTYNITAAGLYNRFLLSNLDANTIVTGSGGASVTVTDYADPQFGPLAHPDSVITFDGINNTLIDTAQATIGVAGNPAGDDELPSGLNAENLTVTGGTGFGTFILGNGNDTLTTAGSNNKITAGTGTDSISVNGDHAIITLNGTNATLEMMGTGDTVFLSNGASGSINGVAPDLHVTVTPSMGAEVWNNFAADSRQVITFTGGAGGFTNAASVMAALQSDGNGGTMLTVGSGSLDFAGTSVSGLNAGMFTIRP